MVPDQFIIAAVVHDIFKARYRNQAYRVILQIAVDGLQHGSRIRLVFQEIKGQERIVKTVREPGILCLREPLGHVQSLGPGKLHQMGVVFNPVGLYREF